jgi:hypothetical protein
MDEADFAKIERESIMGFYSVRKLVEAKKLSDSVAEEKLNCKSFPNKKNVNLKNWHHIDDLYDLKAESLEIKRIFTLVGKNYPWDSISRYNPTTKDYDITQA